MMVRIVNWVLAVRFGVDGIEQGLMRFEDWGQIGLMFEVVLLRID
jgi:hypothetical protein